MSISGFCLYSMRSKPPITSISHRITIEPLLTALFHLFFFISPSAAFFFVLFFFLFLFVVSNAL